MNIYLWAKNCVVDSSLEKQIVKTRNWEAIRYKYQLDYKERLKMERENYLKKCADMKEMSQKQHNVEHLRQFHPNTDECIRKGPYSAVVSNEELIVDPVHSNRHIDERQKNLVSSTETQVAAFNGVTSVANESKNYYPHIKYDDSVCKSIDSTDDYKNRNPFNGGEVEQMQFNRNERGDNIQSEVKQNKITVDSNTVIVSPTMDHEMPKRSQDFDFSIPFNESNILVKVMTPDRKNPSNVCNQHPQPHSLLQNTLLHDTKPTKPDSKSSKRVLSDEESKTNNIRHNSGPRSEWLQYIQNLLNKTTKLADHPAETSKPYFDHCPIPTSTIQKPSVAHVNTTNSQLTKYPDPQSIGRVKVDRPMVSNPRLIRPKVMHPSPYYRSDFFRNNPLYNEPMEDPIVLNMPVRRHSPASLIPDQPSIPPHIEYTYANRPNYRHDFMVRNMQLPLDMSQSHPNLMGQPMYSPYDQQYMQYPIEMERMPHPYIDRFVQHNNVAPPNRSIGFLPPRPIVPGVYRYLNPQHDHPLWIYPHMLER
ncbi:uncharacterized protein LOC119076262 isoform X2 [Bradysia coprophila]|uniref:uncharacterized protein LOC119076262 isoform X2 n=1 Tax=Bradysia coprophila TaxID=38358 RepID=UPI00187D79FA|nr:uncharacterized protein LOC119076262 isoform X2 [Bradysia coprophila]